MANEIDNRIVQMQFDNAQFESGVSTSLGTLDKLKSALNFGGATKGFDSIQAASNRLDFSGIISGVQMAGQKFSMLEIAAITAIQNITNRAVDAGIRLAKSLSVDQITAGWSKFADKAQSVNTIMSATGKSVEEVGEQLDLLNAYTDETSANFTDMTSNIGKFTNAGVKLEDAAQAMQGITNWAYLSGATVSEAGRAMYNLSQAMAVGTVKLMDWKSIENANMATTKFKQTVIDTAVAMGTLKEGSEAGEYYVKGFTNAKVSATNFNAELSRGWFSSEVLTATLDKFGSFSTDIISLSEESGHTVVDLMKHFKEFEENASEMDWSNLSTQTVNADEMAEAFKTMGTAYASIAKRIVRGNKDIQRALENGTMTEEQVTEKTEEVSEALRKAFLEWDAGNAEGVKEYLDDIGVSAEEAEKIFAEMRDNQTLGVAAFRAAQEYRSLRDAIDATMDAVSTGWMKTFELIFGNAEEAKQVWGAVGDALYEVFASGGEARNKFFAGWKESGGYDLFVEGIENLSEAIIGLKELIDEVFGDSFLNIFSEENIEPLVLFTEKFRDFTELLKAITTGDIDSILNPIEQITSGKIAKDLEGLELPEVANQEYVDRIETARKGFETLSTVIEGLAHAFDLIKRVADGIWNALSPVFSLLSSFGSDAIDLVEAFAKRLGFINETDLENNKILGFFENLKNKLGPIIDWLSGVLHTFMETLIGVVDPDSDVPLSDFGNTFSEILGGIGGVLKKIFPILSSVGGMIADVIGKISDKITEFVENSSVEELLDLLKNGLGVGLLAGIGGFVGNLSKDAKGLGDIFGAIKDFITGKDADQKKGFLAGLGDTISEFAGKVSESIKKFVDVEALKTFATAILMIAGALFLLSLVDGTALASSLAILTVAVGELMFAMETFTNGTGADVAKMVAGAAALAILAGGILILSAALVILSLIPAEKMATGLQALAGILFETVIALSILQLMNPGKLIAAALSMLILAPAILVMSAALVVLSLIPAESIEKALGALAGILTEIGILFAAFQLMNPANMIFAAAAMLLITPAIIGLALAFGVLSLIPAEQVESALGAMAGMLTEIGILFAAFQLMNPITLLASALAMLILAPALILMAGALAMLAFIPSEKLTSALIGLAAAFAIIAMAAMLVSPVVGPLLAFAAALLVISASTVVLGAGLMMISAALLALSGAVSVLLDSVVGAIQLLIDTALGLLDSLFKLGGELLGSIIEGIKGVLPDIISAAGDIISGLIDGIRGGLSSVWEAAKDIGSSLLGGIKDFLGIASPSKEFMEVGDYAILGLLESVDDGLDAVANAGKSVGETLMESTEKALEDYDSIMDGHELTPVVDMANMSSYSGGIGLSSLSAARSAMNSASGMTETNNQNVRNVAPVFNIYQQPYQDSEDLAAMINRELGRLYVT